MTLFASLVFAQKCSYSFNGNISLEQQGQLIKEIKLLPNVESCSIIYKEDIQKGQLLFELIQNVERSENENPFSPVFVKELLIDTNLEPLEFVQY